MYKPVLFNNSSLFNNDPFFTDIVNFFETPRGIKRTNFVENDDDYRLEIAVPGLTKDDIEINLDDSILTISHEKKEEDDGFYFTNSFEKRYTLPNDVNAKGIAAKIENGVLVATIPKDKKKIKQRLIPIE